MVFIFLYLVYFMNHVIANGRISPFFIAEKYFLCVYAKFYPINCPWTLSSFPTLIIVNNAIILNRVHLFLHIIIYIF